MRKYFSGIKMKLLHFSSYERFRTRTRFETEAQETRKWPIVFEAFKVISFCFKTSIARLFCFEFTFVSRLIRMDVESLNPRSITKSCRFFEQLPVMI